VAIHDPELAEDDVIVLMSEASIRKRVVMDMMATLFRIDDDRISTMALLSAAGIVTCFVIVSEMELFIRESNEPTNVERTSFNKVLGASIMDSQLNLIGYRMR
jgi:hypothetical protein